MITSSLHYSLLTVGGEFEGDRCFCLCEGTASAPALRGIYDRQRWVSSFPLLERSEGEQHGRWEGRQHSPEGGRRGGGGRWVRGREGEKKGENLIMQYQTNHEVLLGQTSSLIPRPPPSFSSLTVWKNRGRPAWDNLSHE